MMTIRTVEDSSVTSRQAFSLYGRATTRLYRCEHNYRGWNCAHTGVPYIYIVLGNRS